MTRQEISPEAPAAQAPATGLKRVSLVIPARDEEENVRALVEEIFEVGLGERYDLELILIDDGSTDRTPDIIRQLMASDSRILCRRMDASRGKSAAWDLGFSIAAGDVVVTMDADLQNDPRDIPALIEALDEGFDLVSGQRRRRADTLGRKIQSRIANHTRRFFLRDNAVDCGCGLKAFRRECIRCIPMFSGTHRFMEALFQMRGFRFRHVLVNDRPRRFGKAKFGLGNRLLGPFVDMLGVFWLKRRAIRYTFKNL